MDSIRIDLNGSEVASIELRDGRLRLHFSRAYLIKTMTGSDERTRWWQAGDLVLEGVDASSPIPACPAICRGGDIDENIYTYRDMIPIPMKSRGHARCALRFEGTAETFVTEGTAISLNMLDTPKYIEHLHAS